MYCSVLFRCLLRRVCRLVLRLGFVGSGRRSGVGFGWFDGLERMEEVLSLGVARRGECWRGVLLGKLLVGVGMPF